MQRFIPYRAYMRKQKKSGNKEENHETPWKSKGFALLQIPLNAFIKQKIEMDVKKWL